MSNPTCADCKYGTITIHSTKDRCAHKNNTSNFHPYALRHDQALCGDSGAWFKAKAEEDAVYRASK